jgi:pyruvate dehydrogenase E2 component (dihydrolipoamide acetyltransferase)
MWAKVLFVFLLSYYLEHKFIWAFLAVAIAAIYWTSGSGRFNTIRRKIAIGSWKPQKDSAMHACVGIDMTNALRFIDKVEKEKGVKLTPTILVGKAVAEALCVIPDTNGRIVLGRFVPRETIDVCFLVAVPESKNLGYTTLRSVDKMSLTQISEGLTKNAKSVRDGKDESFKTNTDLAKMMPTILLGPIAHFGGFLANVLGITIAPLGIKAHAFGSIVVTSIGMLGYEEAYAPFTPFFHVPAVATICAIKKKPVVVEGDKIEARQMMNITFTVDHRMIDAYEGAKFSKRLQECLANPEQLEL